MIKTKNICVLVLVASAVAGVAHSSEWTPATESACIAGLSGDAAKYSPERKRAFCRTRSARFVTADSAAKCSGSYDNSAKRCHTVDSADFPTGGHTPQALGSQIATFDELYQLLISGPTAGNGAFIVQEESGWSHKNNVNTPYRHVTLYEKAPPKGWLGKWKRICFYLGTHTTLQWVSGEDLEGASNPQYDHGVYMGTLTLTRPVRRGWENAESISNWAMWCTDEDVLSEDVFKVTAMGITRIDGEGGGETYFAWD